MANFLVKEGKNFQSGTELIQNLNKKNGHKKMLKNDPRFETKKWEWCNPATRP